MCCAGDWSINYKFVIQAYLIWIYKSTLHQHRLSIHFSSSNTLECPNNIIFLIAAVFWNSKTSFRKVYWNFQYSKNVNLHKGSLAIFAKIGNLYVHFVSPTAEYLGLIEANLHKQKVTAKLIFDSVVFLDTTSYLEKKS